LAVESCSNRTIKLITKYQSFTNTMAERRIIRTGEHTIDRQVVWWLLHELISMTDVSLTLELSGGKAVRLEE